MHKRLFLSAVVFLAGFQVAFADTELWSVDTFQFPVKEKVKFNLIPELRFRGNGSELYYFQTYIGPALILSKNIEIDAYYALNYSKNGGNWSAKGLGYFDLIYRTDLPWFTFSNRGRFEYDISPDVLKYRNLFGFSKDGWFAGEEFFYNFKKGFYDEGRASIAYSFKVLKSASLSLGYLLRRQRATATSDWQRTNVVTAGVKIVY